MSEAGQAAPAEGQAAPAQQTTTQTQEATQTPAPSDQNTEVKVSDWTANLSQEQKDYVTNKGFQSPESVLDSYINLEKLRGVPQDRLLKLPDNAEDPTWKEVYNKLGRPENPDGYDFKLGEEDATKFFKDTFHELGLTKSQAEGIMQKYADFEAGKTAESDQQYQSKVESQDLELKKEWGAAYHSNIAKAQQAAREFGIPGEAIDAMEKAIGFDGVMKVMHSIGSKLGEDSYISGGRASNPNGAMTPEQAQSRIRALRQDKSFVDRYTTGDTEARQEMERLHKYAYPGA